MTDLLPSDADPSINRAADAVAEARDRIAAQGYTGRIEVTDHRVYCCSCRSSLAPRDIRWRVIEVVADPQQMVIVGGIRCPVCGERGVASTALDIFDDN